jgi:hypothetical protein
MKITTLDPDLLYHGPILTKISPCGAFWQVKICCLVAKHLVLALQKKLRTSNFMGPTQMRHSHSQTHGPRRFE